MSEEILEGYVRVSDILKPFTKFDHIDPDVLENAADRGTRVHAYCEKYANNIFLGDIDVDCRGYLDSFMQWYDENVVNLLYREVRLYDEMFKFTGKFDMVVELKYGEVCLIDLKTPATKSKTWPLQLAAYDILIKKAFSIDIEKRMVVQIQKNGSKAKVTEYDNREKDTQLFLSALKLYDHFNK